VWRSPGALVLGERSEPSSYPSGVAVVARDAGSDIAVQVMGRWPALDLSYDVGVTGRAMIEKSPPGVAPAKFRAFTRFMIPQLDPAGGAVSHLRVTILPKTEPRGRNVTAMIDDRRYWRAEITQLGAAQAVDLFPTDEDDQLSAIASNSYVLVAENGSSTQTRVQNTQLAFVAPPPTAGFITVIAAIADVPPDRAQLVGRALRALDAPIESSVDAIVLGASSDEVLRSIPPSLVVPVARAKPEALLRRALAASNHEHPIVAFTDRPREIARAAAALTFKHPLHVVDVTGPAPRGWRRVLGKQLAEAKIVEGTGGIWIELADTGAPPESLWDHLVAPRFLDDITLTLNGAPFRAADYLAAAFETPGQPSRATPPPTVALGSEILAMLVSVGPRPGASKDKDRWELTGLSWNHRLHFRADVTEGYVAVRNLRGSPALAALPAPYRSAMETYLSQLHDVLPGTPQAYVAP
jgi:hypothetical protein